MGHPNQDIGRMPHIFSDHGAGSGWRKLKLENSGGKLSISSASMIAGNPRAGRLVITLAIALLLLILASTGFIAMRKRTAPEKEPPLPLHSSSLMVWRVPQESAR
jgi:hypothetical protein